VSQLQPIESTLHNLTSPKRSFTFWGLVLVLFAAALLLWAKHGVLLADPNAYFLSDSPDCVKNYMTTVWHVERDTTAAHYGGMSYPFGEHVLFTDNQPILSTAMQWWSRYVSDLRGKAVGILNVTQVLSLLLGCGVFYLLLRKMHLPVWYSGLGALGVIALSPQYGRFDVHFGLSHTWIFPLFLLLLCRYEERSSRRYQSLLIGILIWTAAQLHFYYFGLAAIFLGFYTAFQLLRDPSFRNFWTRTSHLVVMIVLPFVLLNIWIRWTDYAGDRPASPYGFTTYLGQWEGVFLPYKYFPLYQWIDKNIVPIREVNGETTAYVGLAAFVFTVWALFRRFRIFEKSWDESAYHRVHKRYLYGILTAAVLTLLFACGFPFAIEGLNWIVEYLGPVRQFRGLGRFTWAFYYVINLLLLYVCWNRSTRFVGFSDGKYKGFRWAIALAPLAMLLYEAQYFQRHKKVSPIHNMARKEILATAPDHWLNKVDFSSFQALLKLPYYHAGSENIWLDFDSGDFSRTQATAVIAGKPDMGVNMSRTALSHTLTSVQFVYEPGEIPAMLDELPDERPIALLVHPERWETVQKRYRHLLEKSKPVYEHPQMKIFSLAPDSLRAYIKANTQRVADELRDSLVVRRGQWLVTDGTQPFYYQSFDSIDGSREIFQGKGALHGTMRDTAWLFRGTLPKGRYTLSLWVYVRQDMGMTHEVKIVENYRADNREVHFQHEGLRFYLRTIINGWALFEVPMEVYDADSKLGVFLLKEHVNQPFWADEVLIKPEKTTLYRSEPGWMVRNNFWYRK
jgi:hypothetical protein